MLVAEGIETNATVSVNGKKVVSTDDSWLTYTSEIQSMLKVGNNTLEVAFTSVYDACEFSDPFHANVTCPGRVCVTLDVLLSVVSLAPALFHQHISDHGHGHLVPPFPKTDVNSLVL